MDWLDAFAWLVVAVPAVVLHEVAHAYVAYISGDPTPKLLGRVSLNPLRHMEVLGTVVMPIISLLGIGVPFGWAKPVPVNFLVLNGAQRIRVALAGPLCNLLQCGAWMLLFLAAFTLDRDAAEALCVKGILVNALLAGVNLLPVLPLDGGRALHAALPKRYAVRMARYEWVQVVAVGALLGAAAYWWHR